MALVRRVLMCVAAGLCLLACSAEPRRGKAVEQWEDGNGVFRVRVTKHAEGNWNQYYSRGVHYVFESSPVGPERWREFTSEYLIEPEGFPRDHVRFVNERTAYVFWHDWFVVTVDGGAKWSRWKLTAGQLGGLDHTPERSRQEVQVAADGAGVMRLTLDTRRDRESQPVLKTFELRTKDYGQHWEVVREL